jgi:MFS family permease
VTRTTSLWRHDEFLKLWTGYSISAIGSQVTVLAIPLTAVLLLGGGATETGLLVAARMAPQVFPGPLIGVWVDRHPRLPVIVFGSLAHGVLIASIPVAAVAGLLSLGQLYAVSFAAGILSVATRTARAAVLPAVVGRTQLVDANSRLQGSDAVAQVAGPSLGGVLVQALTAPVAIAVDAVSFVISAIFVAAMRTRETPHPRTAGQRWWHEIAEGLDQVRRHEVLFRSVVAIALANVEWFAVQAILIVYATKELGLSPALLGLSLAASGPFSVIGAAIATPLTARWGVGPVMIGGLVLEAISRILLPFAGGSELQATAVLILTQALIGLTVPLWSVGYVTLQQAVTPDRLLGRVTSALNFVQFGVAPPAAIGAGVLADVIGLRPTLFIAGVIAVVAVAYLAASPVRRFRDVPATPGLPEAALHET